MRITVFGASGKVGRLVVARALERHHQVTAFVHSHSPFEPHPQLTIIQGDVHDAAAVRKALTQSEAVISTLGSWHTPSKDIVSSAMRAIIPVLQAGPHKRIVSLTGGGAYAPGDRKTLVYRLGHALFSVVAGKIIRDGEEHIRLLAASSLDWTVLRAPVMTNQHLSSYTLSLRAPAPWQLIPRKAVARALLDQVEGPAYNQRAPYIRT